MQADAAEKLAIGVGSGAYKSTRYKAKPAGSPLSKVSGHDAEHHQCLPGCLHVQTRTMCLQRALTETGQGSASNVTQQHLLSPPRLHTTCHGGTLLLPADKQPRSAQVCL